MSEIFLARQPIFDFKFNLHGYELLFRDGFKDKAEFSSAELATSKVLLSSLIDIGVEKVTAGNDCYLNVSKDYLDDIDDFLEIPFGSLSVTIEIEVDEDTTDKHREVLTRLSSEGVKLAIDHFIPNNISPNIMQLFDLIKCDTQKLNIEQIKESYELANKYNCKMIAINIENYQQIPELQELGVDYFQGFFLGKPDITTQKSVQTLLLPVIQTLSRILDPNLELEELDSLISSDVSLSFRVLRLINSARYNVDDIDSISRAIVYLGRDAIKNLTIIIILTGVDDKPSELAKLALIRAKMCETIAKQVGMQDINSYFTVGLLSVLDAMLDQTIDQVISELAISNVLKEGLMLEGIIGQTLRCVLEYEQCSLNEVNIPDLKSSELTGYYLQSVDWAEQTFSGLSL